MSSGSRSTTTERGEKVYWLDAPNGRVTLGPTAVLIGRSPDCNFILDQPDVSRHHVLVRVGHLGPEVLPLGRLPVRLNGVECSALTPLRAGDVLDVRGWRFRVGEATAADAARAHETAWCLERQSGLLLLVTGPTFVVGGGETDDLIVEGWEPAVLSIAPHPGVPVLTALREGVRCGHVLAAGEEVALADDACITYRAEVLRVRARRADAEASTVQSERARRADVVVLEFLPRGGQMTLEIGGRLRTTLLSERRCDLVACLLQPPPPFAPGDFIPEDTLCARIWPGENSGRTELNSLLYRLRQSLAEEGIDPAPLFERLGGGLRFCLAPGARVVVR